LLPNSVLPQPFLDIIETIMPAELSMASFIAACQRPLRKSIRVNTLKISVAQFCQRAAEHDWQLTPIPWCDNGFWIEADESLSPLGNSAEHLGGLFYIQEASSMLPVSALFHQQSHDFSSILDMAAAPGSKTTQIASLMNNQGVLVANEFSATRVKVLHANIERCGVRNAALTNFDGAVFGSWLPEQFDAVLIDAPCSGEGTIRKDPDAMKNWSLDAIHAIAHTQKTLIESAFQALKVGGELVYSTCTLSREENQEVCHYLQQKYQHAVEFVSLIDLFDGAERALTDEGFLHVFPQIYDSEGFFVAKIRKMASVDTPEVKKRLGKFPFHPLSVKDAQDVDHSLKAALNISLPKEMTLWQRDKDIWLFPNALEPMLTQLRFSRMGIKIAETHNHGYRWQHQVATSLATGNQANCIELSIEEAREWYMGRDIRPDSISGKGELLVCYQGCPIGLGKWVGNRIKNGLPRELVKDKNLF
jgi:16S rRNA (cytosine1407-C5)-methyltransferase